MIATKDALQGAEQHHAQDRGDRPDEFSLSNPQDVAKIRQLDQPDGVDDHDRREDRMRHQAEQRRQQQHGQERHGGCREARDLGTRAGHAIDRRLRHAAAARHRSQKCPGDVRHAGREQFGVGPRRGLVVFDERLTDGRRLREAHEGYADRGGPQRSREHEVGQRECRQPGGDGAHQFDPVILQIEECHRRDGGGDADQGCGPGGFPLFEDNQDGHGRETHREGRCR